jgi:hypothetical protein
MSIGVGKRKADPKPQPAAKAKYKAPVVGLAGGSPTDPITVKIVAISHDNHKRITHVQLESLRVYTFSEIAGFINAKQYNFITQAPDKKNFAQVKVRGKKFITTIGNKTKEDNLDYLPKLIP